MRRRDLTQMLFASATGKAAVAKPRGAQSSNPLRYPQTQAEAAAGLQPEDYSYEFGDLRRYGGDPSGNLDSSTALQSAATVGTVIIPQGCTFKILTGATRSGKISVLGCGQSSQLLCDSNVLTVIGGTGSVMNNFQMVNITEPWIITRDSSNWHANISATLNRSNGAGYQPTVNDSDIWKDLTTEQQNQQTGPSIIFRGDANDIAVSRIYGRFVVIGMYDTQYSSVCDCELRGGKGAIAAIFFWNINGQVGRFNKAMRNTVRHSSFSGIAFARNYDFQVSNNTCVFAGESGVKTWQGIVAGKDARCYHGQLLSNACKFNYYDGIDAMADFPSDDGTPTYHQIQSNQCSNNGGDGINCDGRFNQVTDNYICLNDRFGFWGSGLSSSKVSGNFCVDNNQSRHTNQHDLSIVGKTNNNMITENWVWAGVGQNNYGIYAPGANYVAGNFAANGSNFFFGGRAQQ
jgi:hypothetical protein